MKNQVNIVPPEEMNKALIIDPRENKLCTIKELRIVLLKKFSKLKEHRKLKKIRKIVHERMESTKQRNK